MDKIIVDQLLWHSFKLMTKVAIEHGNDDVSDSTLIVLLHNHAVEMRWIPKPTEVAPTSPSVIKFGEYQVSNRYVLRFFRRLLYVTDDGGNKHINREFVSHLRNNNFLDLTPDRFCDNESEWFELLIYGLDKILGEEWPWKTNPPKIIKDFCKLYAIKRTTELIMMFCPEAVDVETKKPYVDPATKTGVLRGMLQAPKKRPNSTPYKKLCAKVVPIIKAYDAERKKEFQWLKDDDLLWFRA